MGFEADATVEVVLGLDPEQIGDAGAELAENDGEGRAIDFLLERLGAGEGRSEALDGFQLSPQPGQREQEHGQHGQDHAAAQARG